MISSQLKSMEIKMKVYNVGVVRKDIVFSYWNAYLTSVSTNK